MKTKTFILLSLLICNLLPAQNVKLDIKPHFLGVRADSLFVSMDISVEIEDMNPKNAVILTPILTGQDRKILLPAIQLNGKQKQKLYVRNQILRKKKNSKESNTAYLVTGIDDEHSRTIAYQTSLPAEQWMNDAALYLRRTIVRPESEQTLKDTLILAPQYAVLPPNVTATDIPAQEISATTMSTNSMPSISPTPVNKKLKQWFCVDETSFSHRLLRILLTFSLVSVSWIFFRAGSVSQGIEILKRILGFSGTCWFTWGDNLTVMGLTEQTKDVLIVCLGILSAADICKYRNIHLIAWITKQGIWFRWLIYFTAIFGILIFGVYGPGYDASQFIYFQF